jgi:hypothetical protein
LFLVKQREPASAPASARRNPKLARDESIHISRRFDAHDRACRLAVGWRAIKRVAIVRGEIPLSEQAFYRDVAIQLRSFSVARLAHCQRPSRSTIDAPDRAKPLSFPMASTSCSAISPGSR